MAKNNFIITRKIEIYPIEEDSEKRKEAWGYLRQLEKDVLLASNSVVNQQWFNECFVERLKDFDSYLKEYKEKAEKDLLKIKEKLKNETDTNIVDKLKKDLEKAEEKIKKGVSKEAYKRADEYYGYTKDNTSYKYLAKHFPNLPSAIYSRINDQIMSYFKNELFDVKTGKRSIRNYKKGLPIPFDKRSITKIQEEEHNFTFKWLNSLIFKTKLGRDKSDNYTIIKRIIDGTYKMSDSSIQFKKKKLFLNLVVKIPKEEKKLNDKIAVGVDLGLSIPAYISLNHGLQREAIGNIKDFTRVRTQMQARRRVLQKALKIVPGGSGREKKLAKLNIFREKERNFVKTYNHMVSKRIINFALNNSAGVIKLEFLEGFPESHTSSFVLRNWSYYELQQMILYKADKYNIKVITVDPYHTSQTCHICGHYEEGQRLNQSEFQCKNGDCKSKGEVINADYNASKNIAMSEKVVSKKEECEYYKKNKELKGDKEENDSSKK